MPLITSQLAAYRDRADLDWSDAGITGLSGSEKGLPRLAVTRWANDRIGFRVPDIDKTVECAEKGVDDWEFTLNTHTKIRFRKTASVWMPEGERFTPELGALQVDFTFDEKPASNIFPMFLSLPPGCRMEIQPPLTQEEIDGRPGVHGPCTRHPWCVWSYACYSADNRKLLHFPRPFAYELTNPASWTWGYWQWNSLSGALAKVIPQKWLDEAKYPIVIDDTFGQTSIGGSGTTAADDTMSAHGPYSPGSDGTLDSVSFYVNGDESGNDITLGLGNDNSGPAGGSLVDDSAGGAGPGAAGWLEQDMDGSESILGANQYWLLKNFDNNCTFKYDASGSIDWYYKGSTYSSGSLDDPFPAGPSKLDWEVSIFGTYTPGGVAHSGQVTEGVVLGDTLSATLAAQAAITDGAIAGEAWATLLTGLADIAEGAKAGDTTTALLAGLATLLEGTKAGDSMAGTLAAVSAIVEGSKAGDAWLVLGSLLAAETEGAKAGDQFGAATALVRTIAEGAKAGDQFAAEVVVGLISAAWAEGSTAGDWFGSTLLALAGVTEGVLAGDTFSATVAGLVRYFRCVAGNVFIPGRQAGQVYQPGRAAGHVYVPGRQAGQVLT